MENHTSHNPAQLLAVILSCALFAPSAMRADILLSEDFSSGDGGFVESNLGNTTDGNQWLFNAASQSWRLNGDTDLGVPSRNNLTSPTLDATGADFIKLRISFDHRYSIEPDWDGCGLFISINGEAFERVGSEAFVEEGYRPFSLIGNHDLGGLEAFNGDSAGYAGGTLITSIADIPGISLGDTVAVQFVGAFDEFARGAGLPNWEIARVQIETLVDTDGDGMPDVYEEQFAPDLNPIVDDADLDPDMDGLTNLEEYNTTRTFPNDPDSDDDGLLDGGESNSGVYGGPAIPARIRSIRTPMAMGSRMGTRSRSTTVILPIRSQWIPTVMARPTPTNSKPDLTRPMRTASRHSQACSALTGRWMRSSTSAGLISRRM